MNLPDGLLVFAVAFPVLLAMAAARRKWGAATASITPLSTLPALAVSLWVAPGTEVEVHWLVLSCLLGVDSIGRVFLFCAAVLWLLAGVFAQSYLVEDERRLEFFFFYLLAMSGNFGLILAQDAMTFYLCFAVMSFSSYGLVIFSRNAEALRAGLVYIVLVVLGELLLFTALVILVSDAGGAEFVQIRGHSTNPVTMVMLWLGFGIKAGALPLHVWLPLAHPAAPVPASAVLSGAMIKAGLVGWLRFLPLGGASEPNWGAAYMTAGLTAAFYGVVVGAAQRDPKTVLAYSSISQMGLMTIGVGAALASPGAWQAVAAGAVALYAMHHGLAKGTLFLGVGVPRSAHCSSARLLRRSGLVVTAASLAGAPWTAGALAKSALKSSLGGLPAPWSSALAILLPLAAAGTAVLMVRFLFLVWADHPAEAKSKPHMWASWGLLVGATASAPWFWTGARHWIAETLAVSSSVTAVLPLLAGGFAAWLAWRITNGREVPDLFRIPAGDVLVAVLSVWRRSGLMSLRAALKRMQRRDRAGPLTGAALSSWAVRTTTAFRSAEGWFCEWTVAGTAVLLLFFALLAWFLRP